MSGNGDGNDPRAYTDAMQAQQGERITNLGRRQSDLESEMRTGFRQMETAFSTFSNETRSAIATLSSNIADRSRPQWQALGVMVSIVVVLGGLVYWPIRESTNDLKTALLALSERSVTRTELDWRGERSAEDRKRTEAAIADIRAGLVPRAEHERVWQSYDQRFADEQRQLDELKSQFGSVYSQRDVVRDILERLDRAERRAPVPLS